MKRHLRTVALSLATCTLLANSTGCEVGLDADIGAQTDDEFRLIVLTYFGLFTFYVDIDSCDAYWDVLGDERAADVKAVATCTDLSAVNPGSGGVIIDIDPEVVRGPVSAWTLGGAAGGVVTLTSLDDQGPCAASDPELCPWLLDNAKLLTDAAPALVAKSPSGTGGLASARMSASGLQITAALPQAKDAGYVLVEALEPKAALVSKTVELGSFDDATAVDVTVSVGPEGLVSVLHHQLGVSAVPVAGG